jgi:twitching motility protein PilJ
VLSKTARGLQTGDDELKLSSMTATPPPLKKSCRWWTVRKKAPRPSWGSKKILTQIGSALRLINRQSSDLLEIAESHPGHED